MHDSNETYVHNVLAKTRMMPATTTMVTSAPPSGVVVGWGFVVGVADSMNALNELMCDSRIHMIEMICAAPPSTSTYVLSACEFGNCLNKL